MTILDGFMLGFGICCGIFAFLLLIVLVAGIVTGIASLGKKR